MEKHNKGRWRFYANASLQKTFERSGFVFVSILPGDFNDMSVNVMRLNDAASTSLWETPLE
ncbi:MAG: hypothetical protein LBG43_01145 [Treponema sp.]|nr:hypothetical protein [Treponema sp.]